MADRITPFMSEQAVHPKVDRSCFVSPNAEISGDVTLGEGVSVWPFASIRGDLNKIAIGEGSNVQDGVAIHVTMNDPVVIGKNVSIGHGAIIHGAKIDDLVIIGMNATLLDGVEVGTGSIIGANALVTAGTKIPPYSLVLGVPAKVVKENKAMIDNCKRNAEVYHRLRDEHKAGKFPPFRTK